MTDRITPERAAELLAHAYDLEITRPGRFPSCDCNDEDCMDCSHYPELVWQAKKRIAARAALDGTTSETQGAS